MRAHPGRLPLPLPLSPDDEPEKQGEPERRKLLQDLVHDEQEYPIRKM
ncbi:hypothetical protein AB0B28_18960 [Glycomyces sp. NPDC046736]